MSDNEVKPWSGWTGWLIGIIIVIAGVTFTISSISSIYRNYTIISDMPEVKDYPYFTDIERNLSDTVNAVSDRVLITELWHNQRHIHNMQADLLADVRQETNNSLEKITSELNFWIAILALIGVFVPIAITYKGERDFKDRMNQAIQNINERINLRIRVVGQQCSEWEERVNKCDTKYNELSKELTDRAEKYIEIQQQIDLETDVCTMSSVRNNRFLENDRQTEEAYRQLSERAIKKFIRIFDESIRNDKKLKDEDSKWHLTKMCMLCYDMLRNITLDHSGPTRPRYLYSAEESIKQLINELMKEIPDYEKVCKIFRNVDATYGNALERMKSSY